MKMHLHHLRGCAPAPLAHYLKALGILRVVARQKDAEARGFWKDEHFCLLTSLDKLDLERFLLDEYEPTPFVSPWNKGSGFYTVDDVALGALKHSTAKRFSSFRSGIAASSESLADIVNADADIRRIKGLAKKKAGMSKAEAKQAASLKADPSYKAQLSAAEREFKRLKANLYKPFALGWRGPHRDWLDAAMILADDGTPTWPALLGTGGNDGRLDFTNNAMQRLGELFDLSSSSGASFPTASSLLANALWGEQTNAMETAAIGQYLPGTAGGANGTTGPDSPSHVNPWDFVLMLEGAVMFRGLATRRFDSRAEGQAAVPFAVHAHAVGHGTRGRENTERGEQWLPLWDRPATAIDIGTLLSEGRAQLRRSAARRPLDFARAVSRLGVARGLIGFERYGYLERNGKSKIAVPLGRITTGARIHGRRVDDLADWLDRLQRLVRDGDAPSRLAIAEGAIADAVFTVLTANEDPRHWQAVLMCAAKVEALQMTGTAFETGPLPSLSAGWLDAAQEDSPEWRLAVALGSAAAEYEHRRPSDPVRSHVLTLAKGRYATTAEKRLAKDPRVVMLGRDPLGDLVRLVERRVLEATQSGQRTLPLTAPYRRGARTSDLASLLKGQLDVERVVWLGRALMAVQWSQVPVAEPPPPSRVTDLDEGWTALRLCGTPFPIKERRVPIDLALVRRLASGDVAGAVSIALRRLSAAGYRPPLLSATVDATTARRWAAALAFPINKDTAIAMAERF